MARKRHITPPKADRKKAKVKYVRTPIFQRLPDDVVAWKPRDDVTPEWLAERRAELVPLILPHVKPVHLNGPVSEGEFDMDLGDGARRYKFTPVRKPSPASERARDAVAALRQLEKLQQPIEDDDWAHLPLPQILPEAVRCGRLLERIDVREAEDAISKSRVKGGQVGQLTVPEQKLVFDHIDKEIARRLKQGKTRQAASVCKDVTNMLRTTKKFIGRCVDFEDGTLARIHRKRRKSS